VFREVQTTAFQGVGFSVAAIRLVHAQADACRVMTEKGEESAATPGAYLLITLSDAFLVDPARAEAAPVEATGLKPVGGQPADVDIDLREVSLVEASAVDGERVLGQRTRRRVYDLRYTEVRAAAPGAAVQHEERHEIWGVPWRDDLTAWRQWRVAEDAGAGAASPELRDALERIQADGLPLRHQIERRRRTGNGEWLPIERVRRDITAYDPQEFEAGYFSLPADYRLTEFLAPTDEPGVTEDP